MADSRTTLFLTKLDVNSVKPDKTGDGRGLQIRSWGGTTLAINNLVNSEDAAERV
jgi:hypothetical protein